MTVAELIQELEYLNPEAEVRLAEQPRWAFEHGISQIAEAEIEGEPVVYIAEGGQLGYLPSEAHEVLNW
jgi:hypothetical protein